MIDRGGLFGFLKPAAASSHSPLPQPAPVVKADTHEEEAVYTWGGRRGSAPSLQGQLRLACRKVKTVACSLHYMVVTEEKDGDALYVK